MAIPEDTPGDPLPQAKYRALIMHCLRQNRTLKIQDLQQAATESLPLTKADWIVRGQKPIWLRRLHGAIKTLIVTGRIRTRGRGRYEINPDYQTAWEKRYAGMQSRPPIQPGESPGLLSLPHPPYPPRLYPNLRMVRQRRGFTQKALAKACRVDVRTIRAIEYGQIRTIPGSLIQAIAHALSVPIQQIAEFRAFDASSHPTTLVSSPVLGAMPS